MFIFIYVSIRNGEMPYAFINRDNAKLLFKSALNRR